MRKFNRCGLFFIAIIILCFALAFGGEKSGVDLEPIIISRPKAQLLNSYLIESGLIENLPFSSPLEALSILPIDLQSRSPKSAIQTDFSLRGSNFQGVLMLLDGQRLNDPQTAHHNADIPLTREDVARIEVIPGVSSALFGPDAIGGAVNFIVKKPTEKKMILESSFGRYRTWGGLMSISEKINNLGFRLSVENQESGGFREDTDYKKFTTSFNSLFQLPQGEFDLGFGYQEKEFGAYDFYTPGSGYPSKEWTETYLLNTGLNLKKDGLTLRPNFLWRRHFDKFMLDKTLQRSLYLNHHETNIYTPSLYLQKENTYLGRLGLGLEYGQEGISSTNLGNHTRSHASIFTDFSKDFFPQFSCAATLRLDNFDNFGLETTGSVNLRYRMSREQVLNLGVARSMRIPSFTELYYNDPTTIGDPNLAAEKSLNYEAGYNYEKENLAAGMRFFFRQENEVIDWVKHAPSDAKFKAENITRDEVLGTEAHLKLRINRYLDLDTYYTYINKHIGSDSLIYKYGENYSKHLLNANLVISLPFGVQTVGLIYKKKPSRRGWWLCDTRLSYDINKHSRLFLNITNFFNVEYQEIAGIPQPGRWVEGGLRFDW